MTASEINALLSFLGSASIGAAIGGGVVYMIVKSFIPSYLAEKGKNLATKEDVGAITNEIESIKAGYAEILEEVRSENQLQLAAIEREKTTKKEVYMDAVEAITRTQNMVATFPNLTVEDDAITSSLANDAGKIAKVQVVGSSETVKAVTQFTAAVGHAVLELMLVRSELLQRKQMIEFTVEHRDKAVKEIDRYIELMKNLNLAGNSDSVVWDTINQNVEFETKLRDDLQSELNVLYDTQTPEHLAFTEQCLNRHFEISKLLPDAVLSVRRELELEIADDEYLDIFNNNLAIGRKAIAEFIGTLKEKVAQQP